jgi:uncharacterized protein (TIGR02600 family)
MKPSQSPTSPSQPRRTGAGNKRGVALIVVLSCLMLVCGLVLSFFLSISTETKASKLADSGGRSRDLTDTATNLVMAQIRAATTLGSEVAWASQPGMIRTYADSSGTGAGRFPRANYKLYSAKNMVWKSGGGEFDPTEDLETTWSTNPNHFTDLNLPVKDLQNVDQYPIVDPRSLDLPANQRPQGFDIVGAPLSTTTPTGATINKAPMPVRWLYVLRDGQLTAPTGGNGSTATWTGANAPTMDNPIAGRIAFWTDDDTNKVNINTAAGDVWTPSTAAAYAAPEAGSYWAPPHVNTVFDKQALANFQPAQGEYQRYPGHPATTYLSAVFPTLTRDQIGIIASRIQTGGSKGGTAIAGGAAGNEFVTPDPDRLYASIDELVYDPRRLSQSAIDKATLERSRFFLTAQSRAPETNLFNQPRVAMWPVHKDTSSTYRTAFDKLIAFCSRVGSGYDYYFSRASSTSPTLDYEGASPSDAGPKRNRELYAYLQNLTARPVPGFGGNFLAKYPQPAGADASDRDQILTEIFDYVRSTNLHDDLLKEAGGTPFTPVQGTKGHGQVAPIHIGSTQGFGRFYTISEAGIAFICTADGKVAESNTSANKTLPTGTTLTNTQRQVEAILMLELFSPGRGSVGIHPDMRIKVTGLETMRLGATLMGFPAEGVIALNTAGSSLYHGRSWGGTGGFRLPLYNGTNRRVPARGHMPADAGLNATNVYPFVSQPITVNAATDTSTMIFSGGGNVVLELHSGNSGIMDETTRMQTIRLQFQTYASMPIPKLITTGTPDAPNSSAGSTSAPATDMRNWWSFSSDGAVSGYPGRLSAINRNPGSSTTVPYSGSVFRNEDVLRSLLPLHSDFRLIAASNDVPIGVFEIHPKYKTNSPLAHAYTETIGANYIQGGDVSGKFLAGASYASNVAPDVPSSDTTLTATNAATATGDWDTGIATYTDGPYINKPDEGNNARKNTDGSSGAVPYYDRNEQAAALGATFFSPNRQISSPVMFGSLPTGLKAQKPWQTLLFRPHTGTGATHKGADSPADHLLLDLFWMPIVEPYAISEPFSTAGKIAMNWQLMPFTYIERTTGLHALFRSERVVAIPKADANKYKGSAPNTYRYAIDAAETLKQFRERFNTQKDLFRSASELCSLYLVPEGQTLANMGTFWTTNSLTGDNLKERPYSTLYPRLTTKSNTYTVHYKVQVLRQAARSRGNDAAAWASWDDRKDEVLSEARGSSTIERYVDPADPNLPDYATLPSSSTDSLDRYYRFRVINTKKFAP